MSGICTQIHRGLLTLDTIISGSHEGQCGDHCIITKNGEGKAIEQSHSKKMPTPVTQMGIWGRAKTAVKVVAWNTGAIIGNTLCMVLGLILAIATSYKLLSAKRRPENVGDWKGVVRQLKYMAQNVYYTVKYVLLGLTPLTLGVELYKHCNGIKRK